MLALNATEACYRREAFLVDIVSGLVASLKAIPPIAIDVTVAWFVCLYVCMCVSSVTLVQPAKAVGRNEMPFARNSRVAPSNMY